MTTAEPRQPRRGTIRRALAGAWLVAGIGVFVAAVTLGLLAFELWREDGALQAQAFRETRNLVVVLDAQIARTIQSAEATLGAFAEHSRAAMSGGPVDAAALRGQAALLLEGVPQVRSLTLIDASGRLVASTDDNLRPGEPFAEADSYRRAVAAGPTANKPFLGFLTQGRDTGRWLIPMSRGVYDGKGNLLGVAVAEIDPSSFVDLFRSLEIGRFSAVTLAQRNGMIVARSPDNEKFVGRSIANGQLMRRFLPRAPADSVHYRGVLFGRDIIMSYRPVADTPYIINVAFDGAEVMRPWYWLAELFSVVGLSFVLAIVACGWLMFRDQSRRAALAAADQVRDIIDGMSTHVVLLDRDGTIVEVNPAPLSAAGLRREDVIGRHLWDTYWHAHSPEAQTNVRAAVERAASGQVVRGDFPVRVGANALITVDATFQAVRESGGRRTRLIVSGIDVTERRSLEQQLAQAQKMEAIGQLAGGIAHDFNNILTAILGFAGFLVQDLRPGTPQHGFAGRIVKSGESAKELVQQILAFSRRTGVERAPLDLAQVVNDTRDLLRASLPSSTRFEIVTRAQGLVAKVNAAQVGQILVNLCVNANDALMNEPGDIIVEVSHVAPGAHDGVVAVRGGRTTAGKLRADQAYAKISVTDSGKGMDQAVLDRIFDPFFTTKERGHGTGLGLAVVHGVIMAYDGAAIVTSRPGGGTCVEIYLPLGDEGNAAPVAATAQRSMPGHERILVVDDEIDVTDMLAIGLGRLGYDVTAFNDPVEALDWFAREPARWSVVISDQVMPRLKGLTMYARMKTLRPSLRFILCTGYSDGATEEMALAAGAAAYFLKPVSPAELASAVRQLLAEQAAAAR